MLRVWRRFTGLLPRVLVASMAYGAAGSFHFSLGLGYGDEEGRGLERVCVGGGHCEGGGGLW